ncbi:uncharacterized protein PV09_02725 [Verruconis gallopava]|uniref:HPt domain-containing protein n=1 Tax=Verruconis gallopava TaxID=253628 RepID=A0A0D1YZW8_9PEZI|nr:uncharacterized protein PV09_02725 [Verruconis gallopava]KIW06252.1 hypothetical protein PV09_02725 [Verruconis gallopava]
MAPDESALYLGDDIDRATFEQILEMDDDENDRDFSRSIVFDFFEQASETFEKMQARLAEKNLEELSALGHFLKGSSATLGLTRVKDSCEKIQHYGARKDATGTKDEKDDAKSLERIERTLAVAKADYQTAEKKLRLFYAE